MVLGHLAAGGEAAFGEAALRPLVPVQRLEVEPLQVRGGEDVADQGVDDVGAVALVPIVTVAEHDTHLGLAVLVVDVVAGAVANVPAFQGVHSQGKAPVTDAAQGGGVFHQIDREGQHQQRGGVEAGQLRVRLPAIVVADIGELLFAEADFVTGDNLPPEGLEDGPAGPA